MPTRAVIVIVSLAMLGLAATARGEPRASRVALVVGIDRYDNLRPLHNAVNDARGVAEALVQGGYKVVYLPDATDTAFEAAIEQFATDLAGAELGFFYYAGHGFEVDGSNYLIARDAGLRNDGMPRRSQSVELLDLYRRITRPNTPVAILVDACRNDPMGAADGQAGRGAESIHASVPEAFKAGTVNDLDEDVRDRPGNPQLLVTFSTGAGATAEDGAGDHSPFGAATIQALQTPGMTLPDFISGIMQGTLAASNQRQKPSFVLAGMDNLSIIASRDPRAGLRR
jgi:uncharacterized caspase-like protein